MVGGPGSPTYEHPTITIGRTPLVILACERLMRHSYETRYRRLLTSSAYPGRSRAGR